MLRIVAVLLLAGTAGSTALERKKISADLSVGLSCHIDEIQFLQPTGCIGLDEAEQTIKHGGSCNVVASFSDAVGVDSEILRDGFLECVNGHWSGTRSSVVEYRPRHKRFWGLVAGVVIGAGLCYLFCGGGGTQTVYVNKYPPTFAEPCTPPGLLANYNVDAGKTSADVSWTTPTATDPDGGSPSVVQVSGGSNGGSFEGSVSGKTHYITYKATDSDGLSGFCYFSFTVTILTCSSLPWPDNGERFCENGNILGSSCRYTCDAGYQLFGNSIVTCQDMASPTWSAVPVCEKITCDAPVSPVHGSLECADSGYEYQTICSVTCDEGFGLTGSPYMQCKADKTWSNAGSRSCVDDSPPTISCITPQVFHADRGVSSTSVSWQLPTATDGSDPSPSIVKTDGPDLGAVIEVGSSFVKYRAVDSSGNQSPECTIEIRVEEITCGHPLDTITSQYIVFSCSQSRYTYGTVCNVSCSAHLPLEGTDLITCESNDMSEGVWDWGVGDKPYCRELACPELDPPINGALVYDTVLTRPQYTMMCNIKFDIPDMGTNFNGMFFCTDDGDWSPLADVPDCIEARNARFLNLPSEIFYYRGDCGTADTLEQIKANFQTILDTGLNPYFSTICPGGETCRAENIVVKCGPIQGRRRRSVDVYSGKNMHLLRNVREIRNKAKREHHIEKRQSETHLLVIEMDIVVELKLGNQTLVDALDFYDNITLNILKPAVQEMVDNGTFDIANSTLKSDSFQTKAYGDIKCDEGYMLDRTICKPCPVGYLLNEISSKCEQCPVGTYKDLESQATCTSCPVGYSTKKNGSKSLDECIKFCAPGSYSPDTMETCSPCLQGYYQDEHGQTSCKRCPDGTTTSVTNSSSGADCQYYDVLLGITSGGVTVYTVSDPLANVTWMFWAKALSGDAASTVLRLTSNSADLIRVYLTKVIRVQIPSQVDENVANLSSTSWSHIAVVWDTSVDTLNVYINGHSMYTNNAVTSQSPLVKQGGGLVITSSSASGVFLTGMHLLGTALSQSEITAYSTSCHVVLQDDVINMAVFDGLEESGITIIKSSSCDAIDECRSSPCNGHQCINGQDSYSCICTGGWSGNQCTVPPDFCMENQCENCATCMSRASNYTCECLQGYSGTFCEIPPINGGWSSWSTWTECSRTCGSGTRYRSRECNSPVPDKYGSPCVGEGSEESSCNTEVCPECPKFERKYGTLFNCSSNNSTGTRTCTMYCFDDLDIPTGLRDFQEFTCGPETSYEWDPIEYTLPCIGPQGPRDLSVLAEIRYFDTLSSDQQSTVADGMQSHLQTTACGGYVNCNATVEFSSSRKRSTGTTVTVTFYIPLSQGPDLQFSDYISNGNVNGALQELLDAISVLELTAQYLQNYTSRVFDITDSHVTYTVDTSVLKFVPGVTCAEGQAAQNGLCYECPAGTYYVSGVCSFCERGTYQATSRQSTCISCPSGLTTPTIGATDISQCTEPVTTTTTSAPGSINNNNTNVTNIFNNDNKKVIIAIGISVGAFVIAVIAVVIAVWLKVIRPKSPRNGSVSDLKCDIPGNRRFPRTYVRDPSLLTSRPTTPATLSQISLMDLRDDDGGFRDGSDESHTPFSPRSARSGYMPYSDESHTPFPPRSVHDVSGRFENAGYLTPIQTARDITSPPPPYTPPTLPGYCEKDAGLTVDTNNTNSVYDTIRDSVGDSLPTKLKY